VKPAGVSFFWFTHTLLRAYLFSGLHLLARAQALENTKLESSTTYSALNAFSDTFGFPTAFNAKRDRPAAYNEIMEATFALERRLKANFLFDLAASPPWADTDVVLSVSLPFGF
jgi:hypothetical protein